MKRNKRSFDYKESGSDGIYTILPQHSQFKGNSCAMYHEVEDIGQKLVLVNSYYGASVRQIYNFTSNSTKHIFNYNVLLPQYAKDRMTEIRNALGTHADLQLYLGDDITITMSDWSFNITKDYNTESFGFLNNLHCIKGIKEITEIMKVVKKIVRYNTAKDIIPLAYSSGRNTKMGDTMKIDITKFFNLKQVK